MHLCLSQTSNHWLNPLRTLTTQQLLVKPQISLSLRQGLNVLYSCSTAQLTWPRLGKSTRSLWIRVLLNLCATVQVSLRIRRSEKIASSLFRQETITLRIEHLVAINSKSPSLLMTTIWKFQQKSSTTMMAHITSATRLTVSAAPLSA